MGKFHRDPFFHYTIWKDEKGFWRLQVPLKEFVHIGLLNVPSALVFVDYQQAVEMFIKRQEWERIKKIARTKGIAAYDS